jgi:hypothetical protein
MTTMSVPATEPQDLNHLMEAATALAKLTGSAPVSAPNNPSSHQQQGEPSSSSQGILHHSPANPRSKTTRSFPTTNGVKPKIFPQRLHDILNDKSLADTVTWLPHGRSFVIIRPDVFTQEVLPKYLPPVDARSSTKYPSFTRKLNRW